MNQTMPVLIRCETIIIETKEDLEHFDLHLFNAKAVLTEDCVEKLTLTNLRKIEFRTNLEEVIMEPAETNQIRCTIAKSIMHNCGLQFKVGGIANGCYISVVATN